MVLQQKSNQSIYPESKRTLRDCS